jgi:LysM repeat protein
MIVPADAASGSPTPTPEENFPDFGDFWTATAALPRRPITATPPLPFASCPLRPGWIKYQLKAGDTLPALAEARGIPLEELMTGKCLVSQAFNPGTYIHLPPLPATSTASTTPTLSLTPSSTAALTFTPARCVPPRGWVLYTVRPGDTLYQISLSYGTSVYELKRANCLTSDRIITGDRIYVPNVRPRYTATLSFTPQPPTATRTPAPPTLTPTRTRTLTPTLSPTRTLSPSPTATPSRTVSPTSTATPSRTFTATFTLTPSQTHTRTSTPSSTPSRTFTPTSTPSQAP